VKLNKKAAFTSYSPGWSDCAAAMVQTNAPMMSTDKIQPTLDTGIGNCGHWSGEFKESIPHWRKRRASRGGPIFPSVFNSAAAHTTAPAIPRRTLLAKNAGLT
jgi:hypothetical protein